jgi:Cdc6-like AAA superfamily ATPase
MKSIDDITEISAILSEKQYKYISIDGVDGTGKSTIAGLLAKKLNYKHINIDDFLEINKGYYVKNIRYRDLEETIQKAGTAIILEGVCVLDVLSQLEIKPDFMIYIKRITEYGFWRDGQLYNVEGDIDEFIEKENRDLYDFSKDMARIEGTKFDPNDCNISKLREEIIRYHHKYKPHEKADLIFLNSCR